MEKSTDRKSSHPLVYFPDTLDSQGWAKPKGRSPEFHSALPDGWQETPDAGLYLLPSHMHQQEAGLVAEHRDSKLQSAMRSSGLIHYATKT